MAHSDTVLSNSSSINDKDIQIVKDIFDIIAEKGPISIYRLTKELHTDNKYKDINWNALRMKITRLLYRLILAGMLEYKKGPRNSKLIDLSYNYLYGKYGEIPKNILNKYNIDIEKFLKNPVEETKRILMNKKVKIKNPLLSKITRNQELPKHERSLLKFMGMYLLRDVLELIEPDLFNGWKQLSEKVKDFYYDALIKKEIIRNPDLEVAYSFIKLDETDDDFIIELQAYVYDEFVEKICRKYDAEENCGEAFHDLVGLVIDGKEDYIDCKNYRDLLISKVILPKLLRSIGFPLLVSVAKTFYLVSGNVINSDDVKDIVKESILVSDDPKYVEALCKTIRTILPYIIRRTKLLKTELNAYEGLEEALRELLEETRCKSKK